MPNDKITAVGANIAEKAAMIWNVADMLRGPFKPHEYGLVILPMTVVKRFHDCLLPTHQAVLDTYEKVKKLQVIDGFLQKASGYQFYNTSRFTFTTAPSISYSSSPSRRCSSSARAMTSSIPRHSHHSFATGKPSFANPRSTSAWVSNSTPSSAPVA